MQVWRDRPELWPRSMFCNGHILVNAEKVRPSHLWPRPD